MKKLFAISALATLALAGIARADGTWTGASAPDVVPSHVEVDQLVVNGGTAYAETTPVLFVYMGGYYYSAPIKNEAGKLWAEMAKSAAQNGKKLGIYWQNGSNVTYNLCDGYDANHLCNDSFSTIGTRRILRMVIKP